MPETFPAVAPVRRRVVSTVLALALAAIGVVATAQSARAAAYGPGYDGANGHLGAYNVGGVNVYCLDIDAARPVGATGGGGYSSTWAGLSALSLARLNWAISNAGQSGDRRWTAAVDMYVWSVADAASYNSHGMSGDSWFITRATGADRATILANLAALRAGDNAVTVGAAGTGSATLDIQMFDSYDGQVVVTVSPASATGLLHLDGAVVAGTPADTAPVSNGSVIPIRGTPLDSDTDSYAITASATFTGSNAGGYYGRIAVFTTGSAQPLAGPGGAPPATFSFSATNFTTDPLELQFEPVITTQVADAALQPGDAFVDLLTVGLSATSPANEWRRWETGDFMEVVARGTLYGPLANPPVQSATVSADAPVAWTETITLTGPGAYESSGGFTAVLSGYYSWVWSIDYAGQSPFVQPYLPDAYSWADDFGRSEEEAVTAVTLEASSLVVEAAVGLRQPVSDTLTVTHDESTGPWWTTDGVNPVAAHFVGSAYWLPGDTPPVLSADPPAEAALIGTHHFPTISAPGIYTTPTLTPPAHENGYVVWQWELIGDIDGPFVPWRDQWGLTAETTRVTVPSLATAAAPRVPVTDEATDTAIIGGEPTGESTWLSFAVYGPIDVDAPICDQTTLVADGIDALVEVTAPADYNSPPVQLDELGSYAWVASLWTGDDELIAQGSCGDPSELTEVMPFIIATAAVETTKVGDTAHDTATIVGPTPLGATITFAVYYQDQDVTDPVCDESNRLDGPRAAPIAVTGPGVYASADTRLDKAGTFLWVETVTSRTGVVLHEGACGAQYELTRVQVPTLALASTGATGTAVPLVGALAAVVVGGIILMIRRKKGA